MYRHTGEQNLPDVTQKLQIVEKYEISTILESQTSSNLLVLKPKTFIHIKNLQLSKRNLSRILQLAMFTSSNKSLNILLNLLFEKSKSD